MTLIQPLPTGALDVVGDIHGELQALRDLLGHLGYGPDGQHPEGRSLVFVGDFCDRGPDSPGVLALVKRLIDSGRAVAVIGNHELNLLCKQAKDGSGWYFDQRLERDGPKYLPYERVQATDHQWIESFLAGLPIGLEREDLRVVHAAWRDTDINMVRQLPLGCVRERHELLEALTNSHLSRADWIKRVQQEELSWPHGLEDADRLPPFMHAIAEQDELKQMSNPFRVLTSGVERKGSYAFYSSGKWRFVERVRWWDEYQDDVPVVVGHYWRRFKKIDRTTVGKDDPDLFDSVDPLRWHGAKGNVFCVDFSVGGRWRERKDGKTSGYDFKLAALRWPEKELVFDDGHQVTTQGFGASLDC